MSYIPEIRKRETRTPFSKEFSKNLYWQGYLNDQGVDVLSGYDMATDATENFFENIDVYADEFNQFGFDVEYIDTDTVMEDKELEAYSDDEIRNMSTETRFVACMKAVILHWIELERNQIGVSLIENMDTEECDRIVKAVDQGTRKTIYSEMN